MVVGSGGRGGGHSGGPTPTLDANVDSRDFHNVRRRLLLLVVVAAGCPLEPFDAKWENPEARQCQGKK